MEGGKEYAVEDLLTKNAGTWVEGLGSLYGLMVNCGKSGSESISKNLKKMHKLHFFDCYIVNPDK